MDAVTRLLAELVAIPSVNPMGRPLAGYGYLEQGMTEFLVRWFTELGVPCERQRISEGRENLIARYVPPGAKQTLLFDAHQDTVPTDGMIVEPFGSVIESGKLFGRGSCDVKGGMAAMLTAFARLVREQPSGSAAVIMACTVDEEFTHQGSSRLAATNLGADLGIVAEPTMLQVVNCHKGAVRWKVRTKGVACHSSTPHLGRNAIYEMAPILTALQAHADELASSTPHPVLGAPSLSVGRIEGGQSVNVVPDWCEVEIDRRVIPGEQAADCIQRVRSFFNDLSLDPEGVEFLPPWVQMPALSGELPGTTPAAQSICKVVQKVTGRTARIEGVPYGTDAGPLAQGGLPCLVIGPGDIAQAHTKDEWIELDQVRMAADVYFAIACELGRETRG